STISPVALSIKWLNLPKPFTFNDVFVEFFGVASLMLKIVRDQIRLELAIVYFIVIFLGQLCFVGQVSVLKLSLLHCARIVIMYFKLGIWVQTSSFNVTS
ncbi:hypothetical protein O4H50_21815, partial [Vibrio diazotrophicus]|uniref:hypothetical protein n=1 Tax=Vibrio diazotrophicus TaxID=685 RepID=UPI0022AFC3C7